MLSARCVAVSRIASQSLSRPLPILSFFNLPPESRLHQAWVKRAPHFHSRRPKPPPTESVLATTSCVQLWNGNLPVQSPRSALCAMPNWGIKICNWSLIHNPHLMAHSKTTYRESDHSTLLVFAFGEVVSLERSWKRCSWRMMLGILWLSRFCQIPMASNDRIGCQLVYDSIA